MGCLKSNEINSFPNVKQDLRNSFANYEALEKSTFFIKRVVGTKYLVPTVGTKYLVPTTRLIKK